MNKRFFGLTATFAIGLASMLFALSVSAQAPNDYYKASQDRRTKELLYNVEKYHLQKGISQLRHSKYLYAWADFDFILRYFPNHPRALMLMAELCESWRDRKCKAEEYFSKAVELSPNQAPTHIVMGIFQHQQGKYDQAIESYKTALSLSPSSGNAHYNLGLAYFAKGDYDNANKHAQSAYELGMTLPGLQQKLVKVGAWKPAPGAEKKLPAQAADNTTDGPVAPEVEATAAPNIEGSPLAPPKAGGNPK